VIVGLAGRKQSGKDSAAALLVKELGFRRIAFADKLKDFTAAIFDWDRELLDSQAFKEQEIGYIAPALKHNLGFQRVELYNVLRDMVDDLGWRRGHRKGQTPRHFLQQIGVQARKIFGSDFWLDQVSQAIGINENVVITDVRFWNEAGAVSRFSFTRLIRLNRADRRHAHGFHGDPVTDTCAYIPPGVPDEQTPAFTCNLPHSAHPSHYSGDTHESETTLPDSGVCYDQVFESASAEEQAQKVLSYVKEVLK